MCIVTDIKLESNYKIKIIFNGFNLSITILFYILNRSTNHAK